MAEQLVASTAQERPILFSGPLVRALLAGKKTQTRRIVDLERLRVRLPFEVKSDLAGVPGLEERRAPPGVYRAQMNPHGAVSVVLKDGSALGVKPGEFDFVCPYIGCATTRLHRGCWHLEPHGQDQLWVREAFAPTSGAGPWPRVWYAATDDKPCSGWKPSIHMPRALSRITLEVLGVRLERLQDISDADARAEGLTAITKDGGTTVKWGIPDRDGLPGTDNDGWPWEDWNADPRRAFRTLWERRNGPEGWAANPWVWVVEFRRIEAAP